MSKSSLLRFGIFIVPVIIVFSQCLNLKKKEDPRGHEYAGSATCVSCHKDIYNSYLHTAHFQSAQPSGANTISGSFKDGSNAFAFTDGTKVEMHSTDSGFYQTAYENGKPTQTERFDITFGAVKGESYAYWKGNELFQLPISYVSNVHSWINSPGYDNRISYTRPISTLCMDCHVSYIKSEKPNLPGYLVNPDGFDKSSIVYGVDCERCHGPAAEHVKFQMDNPTVKEAKYIIKFASLTRDQKINMCAICHSGTSTPILRPTFGFRPGDTLLKYMAASNFVKTPDYTHIDVHGNQKALLASSKCFINSKMDCSTCHDTHTNERADMLLYTARCMTCHNTDTHNVCKLSNQLTSDVLKNNCISCHMPAQLSKVIIAGQTGALVHTHHIAVYPGETQKILAYLKIKLPDKGSH